MPRVQITCHKKLAGICTVTGGQPMCKIYYKRHTLGPKTNYTKVKSDQVNYHYSLKVSSQQEPNSAYNSRA